MVYFHQPLSTCIYITKHYNLEVDSRMDTDTFNVMNTHTKISHRSVRQSISDPRRVNKHFQLVVVKEVVGLQNGRVLRVDGPDGQIPAAARL